MKDFREIISDHLEGNLQDKYGVLLAKWEAEQSRRKRILQRIRQNLVRCQKTADAYQPNTNFAYEQMLQKIKTPEKAPTPVVSISKYSFPQKIAAGLLAVIISISIFYLFSNSNGNNSWRQMATQDEFRDFELEDGSHVWLHRNSNLEYPAHFSNDKREINLKGEAFIEVKPESARPFYIHTAANSEIQVMGTALNVRSFVEETEEEIAVASGEVMYRCAANSRPEMKLDKGECAIWHLKSGKIEKMKETDINIFTWKDHLLTFKETDCQTFEKTLERYFNIEIAIKDSSLYETRFSARFENKSLIQILEYFKVKDKLEHEITSDTCFLWKN